MGYTHATQAPNRQQWETNSQYSQSWNCGPTSVSFIVGFYKDSRPAIEYNRRLIAGMGPYNVTGTGTYYGCPPRTPTSGWQQADMMDKRGVPATVRQLNTIAELHGLVDSGRRPTIVGIEMSRVPAPTRGHSFTGWHAVVVISGGTLNGIPGFWIMDPNFPAGSNASRRFYSNFVMTSAWQNNVPRWCVVPDRAKYITPSAPPPTVAPRADYGAVTMRFRSRNTSKILKAGKPIRNGASINATIVARASADTEVHIVGEMKPTGSYDPWYIFKWYMGNGDAFVYGPGIDFK